MNDRKQAEFTGILNRIFPQQFDNTYRGRKLALWIFALLALMKLGISLSAIFDTYNMARSADGIPIETFTSGGAEAVVSVTALLGLSELMLAALCIMALVRYRSMISLLFLLLLVEFVGKKWILLVKPIVRSGPSPSNYINLILLALLVSGLLLSLWRVRSASS